MHEVLASGGQFSGPACRQVEVRASTFRPIARGAHVESAAARAGPPPVRQSHFSLEPRLEAMQKVLSTLDDVLNLQGRAQRFALATPLLGAIPELDSMAVAALITALEERFGFVVDDDEIDGDTFVTVGSLVSFVERKLTQ